MAASGSFSSAFIAAGVLALIGGTVTLVLSRGAIGEISLGAKPLQATG